MAGGQVRARSTRRSMACRTTPFVPNVNVVVGKADFRTGIEELELSEEVHTRLGHPAGRNVNKGIFDRRSSCASMSPVRRACRPPSA